MCKHIDLCAAWATAGRPYRRMPCAKTKSWGRVVTREDGAYV